MTNISDPDRDLCQGLGYAHGLLESDVPASAVSDLLSKLLDWPVELLAPQMIAAYWEGVLEGHAHARADQG